MQSILKSLGLGERVEDKVATLGKEVLGASQARLKKMRECGVAPICTCEETFHKVSLEEYEKIRWDYVFWKRCLEQNNKFHICQGFHMYSYDTIVFNYHRAWKKYESVRPCPYCIFTLNPNNRKKGVANVRSY
jgi:hypothetical protein